MGAITLQEMKGNVYDPAVDAVPVTPSDDTDLADGKCNALYVGGTGALKVQTAAGQARTFSNVVAGTTLLIQCTRVYATGTDATDIVALY